MTISHPGTAGGRPQQPMHLVLTACGRRPAIGDLMRNAAPLIAAALALPLRDMTLVDDPGEALAGLHRPTPAAERGWLAPLGVDPGLPLPAVGCWAEALGAWRQPCLLLVRCDELDTGRPAATVALLRQWRVPLLGLVQWGGPWRDSERRADSLPWLGWLPGGAEALGGPTQDADLAASQPPLDASLLPLVRRQLARLELL